MSHRVRIAYLTAAVDDLYEQAGPRDGGIVLRPHVLSVLARLRERGVDRAYKFA